MQTATPVGRTLINKASVPVFSLPNRDGTYVQTRDAKGRVNFVSVEGAKALKNGQYPLALDLQREVTDALYGEIPFAVRDAAEQDAASKRVLRAMLDRLLAVNPSALRFSEN
jgi:hypothetical protein